MRAHSQMKFGSAVSREQNVKECERSKIGHGITIQLLPLFEERLAPGSAFLSSRIQSAWFLHGFVIPVKMLPERLGSASTQIKINLLDSEIVYHIRSFLKTITPNSLVHCFYQMVFIKHGW